MSSAVIMSFVVVLSAGVEQDSTAKTINDKDILMK